MALVVITGGARSGKSVAAEKLACARSVLGTPVTVVVFGRDAADDPEFAERLARHRADRPSAFATLEAADSASWRDRVASDALVLLDCLGTLLGRAMEEAWEACAATEALVDAPADRLPGGFAASCERSVDAAVAWLLARDGDTIVVTNEVGDGLVPAYATGRLFCDLLGRANRSLVDRADAAYLTVAGRLVSLSGLARDASWPED